jgi:hypothetical protein
MIYYTVGSYAIYEGGNQKTFETKTTVRRS